MYEEESCDQKVKIFLDFKQECQESDEIPLTSVENPPEVKLEPTVTGTKKKRGLEEFPDSQVQEAIKDLKQKFYVNTKCLRCNYSGNHLKALIQHVTLAHKDLKPRWCSVCNTEWDNLTVHLATNHIDDYVCQFCGKKFGKFSQINDHLQCHSDVKLFHCSYCDRSFTKVSYLHLHSKKHLQMQKSEGNADAQLSVAWKKFCVKCNRTVISMFHTTCDNNHFCTVCGKQFKAAFRLKYHMIVHSKEARYKCTYCDKKFKTNGHRIKHECQHTGKRPYVCHVCEKGFVQRGALKTHLLVHNIGPKISCTICNKIYSEQYRLRVHLRTHTGEKPYVCTECGKGFVQRSLLHQHSQTHSESRPFKCSYCDKTFRTKRILKQHMWIHLGEKPYKCNQCSYGSRTGASLTLHMLKHKSDRPREDRPHMCSLCNGTYTTNAMLQCHIKTHDVDFLRI